MDQDQDQTSLFISREVAERILGNMTTWLEGDPANDKEWLAKMKATREIRADFESILADNTD